MEKSEGTQGGLFGGSSEVEEHDWIRPPTPVERGLGLGLGLEEGRGVVTTSSLSPVPLSPKLETGLGFASIQKKSKK